MKKNGWNGASIDIVEMPDGIYTTIDNTRVVSARQAGINVEANIHSYNEVLPVSTLIDLQLRKAFLPLGEKQLSYE